MKRKIGDKVRVRKDLIVNGMYGDFTLYLGMEKCLGNEGEIKSVNEGWYTIKGINYCWVDEMLEDVDLAKDIETSFDIAISQLKNFVIALEECAEKIKTFESCQK